MILEFFSNCIPIIFLVEFVVEFCAVCIVVIVYMLDFLGRHLNEIWAPLTC